MLVYREHRIKEEEEGAAEEEKEQLILPGLDFWRNRQWFGESIPAHKPVGLLDSFSLRTWQDKSETGFALPTFKNIICASHLDICPASQLKFVAKIKVPEELHCTLVDVDPVGCSKQKKIHLIISR